VDEFLVGVLGRGIVDPTAPVVRADDLGLTRGDGCFETCRVTTDDAGVSRVDNLDAHLARLTRSLGVLNIPADVAAARGLVLDVAAAWPHPGEAAVKLMVSRGVEGSDDPTVIATVRPIGAASLRQREHGIRVVSLSRGTSSDAYDDAPWLLGGVKSLSYALNMAALREATRRGADDAIWVSTDGIVLEAPTSTVVWSQGSVLATTPSGASGILAGTTLAKLFDGIDVGTAARAVSLEHLVDADAIWLVSSVRGVAEVIELDGVARKADPALTARLARTAGF
jgi:4-amino-4-deoxychorismate lyase